MPAVSPGTARPPRWRTDVPVPGARASRVGFLAVPPGAPRRGHRGPFRPERFREDDAARRREADPARPALKPRPPPAPLLEAPQPAGPPPRRREQSPRRKRAAPLRAERWLTTARR